MDLRIETQTEFPAYSQFYKRTIEGSDPPKTGSNVMLLFTYKARPQPYSGYIVELSPKIQRR
jgi:hypothetical protein